MNAWIFDVDGVITDLTSKKITEPDILPHIAKLLKKGEVVAFNTGQSLKTLEERVLTPLLELTPDSSEQSNIFAVCEMGNVTASIENGKAVKTLLDDPIMEELEEKIKALAKDYAECMFVDETKETMCSIEMKHDFDIHAYKKRQEQFISALTDILMDDSFRELNFKILHNAIAVDVVYEDAGKHLGAERIEDWMMEKRLTPECIFAFGDNNSDSEMASELENSYKVIFVFVNDKSALKDTPMCEVIYTKEKFTKGTLEFLTSHT